MTTAMPPSARPGIRRGGPLEQGEDRFQLQTEVLDRLGRQSAPRLRLQLARATVLLDLLARPLDRVFLRVQEVLHQHDQLDLASLVHPVARPVLGRVEEAELTLPVPQHVGLQVGELADLADREELLDRIWDAHSPPPPPPPPPHCSAFSPRSLRAPPPWRGGFPPNNTPATRSALRDPTPCRAAAGTPPRAVVAPFAPQARHRRQAGSGSCAPPPARRRPCRCGGRRGGGSSRTPSAPPARGRGRALPPPPP